MINNKIIEEFCRGLTRKLNMQVSDFCDLHPMFDSLRPVLERVSIDAISLCVHYRGKDVFLNLFDNPWDKFSAHSMWSIIHMYFSSLNLIGSSSFDPAESPINTVKLHFN